MLDLRLYRAAFVPVVLALVVVAFSLTDRPRAIVTTLAPDAFDGTRAFRALTGDDALPADDDDALARRVERSFGALRGFSVRGSEQEGRTLEGTRELRTVLAERTGSNNRRIVVLADRSAPGRAGRSATAALLELARVFSGRTTRRTLTLVSTGGGPAGVAAAAERLGPVDAVLVLGDLASGRVHKPWVVPWSNALGVAPLRLQRTVEQSVREETGRGAGGAHATGTIVRLAFPLTVGAQGPLGAAGLPAVLVGPGGELGPGEDDPVSAAGLERFGRAALRSVTALDNGPDVTPRSPQAVVVTKSQVVPQWAFRLLAGALLLPVALGALDGLFRARRRREPMGRWLGWALAGALPFLTLAAVLLALRTTGVLDGLPPAPVAPELLPVRAGALVASVAVAALGWLVVRLAAVRRLGLPRDDTGPGAPAAVALLALAAFAVIWARNPFAALFTVPAAHLWLLAVAPEVRVPRAGAVAMVLLGLVPFALAAGHYASALDAGPLELTWMGVALLAGGHVGVLSIVLWSIVAGCACSALVVAVREPAPEPPRGRRPEPLRSRGPLTYAGPGSLGGTKSALR